MSWHWVDLVILAVITISVITGLVRGFVKELVALCIWVLAIWIAYKYSNILEPWLIKYIQDKTVRTIASFVIILMAMLLLGGIINASLSYLLKRAGLSGTDRLLGMVFGLVRGVFLVALIILVLKMTGFPYEDYERESVLYKQFDPVVNWLSSLMPQFLKQAKTLTPGKGWVDIEKRDEKEKTKSALNPQKVDE